MADKWKKKYDAERKQLNDLIFASGHMGIKRFFALDEQAYHDAALPAKTKELMGLTASMVLRCNDCIAYHIGKCHEAGVTKEEFYEAFNVALIIGGSIVIPHLRTAAEKMEALFD